MTSRKTSDRAEVAQVRHALLTAGLSHAEIAQDFGRRYKMRPRKAWRVAYGWTLRYAAEQVNALSTREGLDPAGNAVTTSSHLCEYEAWPGLAPPGKGRTATGRKPSLARLTILARLYDTSVSSLLDDYDYQWMSARDRMIIESTLETVQAPFDEEPAIDERPKIPNFVLRSIREDERQETREEFAAALAETAEDLGEKVECNWRTIARWEDGETTRPHPAYRRVLSTLLKRPFSELGFPGTPSAGSSARIPDALHVPDNNAGAVRRPHENEDAEPYAPTLLRALITKRHWQKFPAFEAQFRRAAQELAERHGEPDLAKVTVSPRQWERWYAGNVKTDPHPDACRVLEHMFGYPVQQLLKPADNIITRSELTDISGEPPSIRKSEINHILDLSGLSQIVTIDEDYMERRAMLKLIGSTALTRPFTRNLDYLRRGLDDALNSDTTISDVDEWEHVAFEYAHEVGHLPAKLILPDLLTDIDELQARLENSSGGLRTRMVRVCGQLSALTAIALLNVGDSRNASRYWRTALRAVDEVGDRNLQALIRGRRAIFALYGQRPASSAMALADDAINSADGTPCAGAASGYAARAQTLALLGRRREAREAVQDLAEVFTQLPDSTTGDRVSQWGWGEQRLRHVESHVYSYTGCPGDAAKAQDAALRLYPTNAYQGPAQIELHKAICLILTGDPSEGARHAIHTVQALPPDQRHDELVRRSVALALDAIPDSAANLLAVSEARDLLALPAGQS